MRITKLVQSTMLIDQGESRLLVDPGKYNIDAGVTTDGVGPLDALFITHKHADHFDPDWTRELHERYRPQIVTNPEIALILGEDGIPSRIFRPGDQVEVGSMTVTATYADHQVRGEVIANFGLIVSDGQTRVYNTSDTGLIEAERIGTDLALGADAMFLPISNRGVVMGIDDALHMVAECRPRIGIPMHYESPKDAPRVRPEDFVARAQALAGQFDGLADVEIRVMNNGDVLDLD